jgi:hypothetical protein
MTEALSESDHGPAVLYWLGQNETEAMRISRLSEIGQIRAIGRIEALIEAEGKAGKGAGDGSGDASAEDDEEVSAAETGAERINKPPTPLRGKTSGNTTPNDKMTDDEWVAAERVRMAALRRNR